MQYYSSSFFQLPVSRLALGCMSLHEHATGQATINAALDGGINFFDTADLYDKGLNEKIVGEALNNRRQEVVIATKVGNRWRGDGSGWDWVPRKDYIISAVEDSLRRLQTDYIDLYQLHGGTIEDPWDEVIEAFEMLRSQGKILAYGVSSIRPNVVRNWTDIGNGATCMSQYSLLDRRPEEFILPHLQASGQHLLVRGALAKGLLAGKPARTYLGHEEAEVIALQKALFSTAGKDQTGLAIAYALQHPAVGSVVLGASSAAQIRESVQAWERISTSSVDWKSLAALAPARYYEKHR